MTNRDRKAEEYIANAAHELKIPITVIKGFAETLHDNPNLPQETSLQISEKILTNCERMERLLKSLLMLADLENITPIWAGRCDLKEIANQAVDLVQSIYPDATIDIRAEGSFHVLGDKDLLEQIFLNLLDNAAKYSPSPAQIVIDLHKKEPNRIIMDFKDRGIGISQEDIEHIFERFYVVNKHHSRRLGGAGLGLSIVKEIVEKHGGQISCISEKGRGTTFQITLPA